MDSKTNATGTNRDSSCGQQPSESDQEPNSMMQVSPSPRVDAPLLANVLTAFKDAVGSNSGDMDFKHFQDALQILDIRGPFAQLIASFARADLDGDNLINIIEYVQAIENVISSVGSPLNGLRLV